MVVLAFPLCNDTRKPRLLQSRRKHNLFAWHISTLTALFALLTQGFASLITQKNILDTSIDDLKVKLAFRMQADGIMEECLGSPINLEHSEGDQKNTKNRWNIFEPMKSNEKDKKEIEPKDTLDAPSKNMDPREDIITNAIHKAFNKCHLQESEVHGNKGISEFRKEIIKTWNQFDNFLERNSIINPVDKKSEKNQHQTSENNLKAKKDTSWLSLIVNIFEKINFVDEIGSAKNNKIEFILNDIVVLFVSLIEKFHLVDRKELGDFLNSEQGQDLIFNYSVGRFLTQNPSSAARLYINYDYENTLKNSLYTQEIHGILGEMNHDSFRYITWILIETEINFQKDKINFFYLEQFQTDLNVIVKRDYNRLRNKSVNEKKIQLFMEDMMERIYQLQIHPTEFTHREQTIASLLHKMLYFILKYYVESKEVDIISKLKKSKYFPFILEFDNAMWNMSKSLKSILSKHQELKQLIMLHPEPENIIDLNFYKIKLLADMSNGIKKTLLSEKYEKYYSFKFNAIENGEEKIGEIIKALSLSWKLRNKMIIHQLSENKIDYNNKYPISSFIEKINYQSVLISECWRQDLNSMNKFQENFSWSSVKQFLGIFRDIFRDIFQKPRGFN